MDLEEAIKECIKDAGAQEIDLQDKLQECDYPDGWDSDIDTRIESYLDEQYDLLTAIERNLGDSPQFLEKLATLLAPYLTKSI